MPLQKVSGAKTFARFENNGAPGKKSPAGYNHCSRSPSKTFYWSRAFSRVYLHFCRRIGCPKNYKENQVLGTESYRALTRLPLRSFAMLFLPLVALGLSTIGAYAKPNLRAAGGLEVSLSTPTDKVTSVSDLKVTVTVKNTGDKNLKIIKSGTVLDNEHYTRSFIVSKDGKDVPFTGAEVCTLPFPTSCIGR